MTEKRYGELTARLSPQSPVGRDCLWAFLVGGAICTLGQFLKKRYLGWGFSEEESGTLTSVTLVALSALATGFSVYDDLAKHAGAGTLVPITGFANAIAAPAVEFKTEGMILGVGAKLFTIAGPVIVYGLCASTVYGVLYYLL